MSKQQRQASALDSPPPTPTPVLVVARGVDASGHQCVAAILVQGPRVIRSVVLESAVGAAIADRSWREWAWRLLRCNEALPVSTSATAMVSMARGLGLAKGGKDWGVVLVEMDSEGLHPEVLSLASTKAEAWDDLERHAAHHLLDDERKRHLARGGNR